MVQQWDERLISQARALELAGSWPVSWDLVPEDGAGRLILRCGQCLQSCGMWLAGATPTGNRRQTSADDMLAAVLRHLVTAHDLPLNKAAEERGKDERNRTGTPGAGSGDPAGNAVDTAGPDRDPGSADDRGPGNQTGDPGREPGTAGGDHP